ncbi:MAG: hypothetical protein M0P70_00170 [Desulfobulbaceae bacterium]|nr:hypothetical protein [Desulfobulbaceae bacterium]
METFLLMPPFSFFDFIETRFGDYDSIRRIFSLARSFHAESLVLENIQPCGIVAEENEDIRQLFPAYSNTGLLRLSFWKRPISTADSISLLANDDFVGYAIVKRDTPSGDASSQWHVFEAVFPKYDHAHNCVPHPQTYHLAVDGQIFAIKGLLYCQQNGLNKACAQVAIRSLLSRILPEGDISYRRINEIAATIKPGFNPQLGLSVPQIRQIFHEVGLLFNDVDYSENGGLRKDLPYQKFAYAGLESGGGALVGFRLTGRNLQEEAKHIIPIYGHTFNKDTWAPNADISYFRIGENVGYVPSESWTSSFLGHDDNFGPNFCIPRLYIARDKVDYVMEIFRPGVCYSGVLAEALALAILYSLLPCLTGSANKWILRLIQWTNKQQVVFRAQAMTRDEYVNHLQALQDWEGNKEKTDFCTFLVNEMPRFIWLVEISTPQLFPANERKLGEIVLDATRKLNLGENFSHNDVFMFARLPGSYLFGGDIVGDNPQFTPVPSELLSHTELSRL